MISTRKKSAAPVPVFEAAPVPVFEAAPVPVFEAGEQARVECVNGAGETMHTYYADRRQWCCGHCGAFTAPETPPTVQRPQDVAEASWRPPDQPTEVRVRLMNGEKFSFPFTNEAGYEILVRPFGGHGQMIGWPAHEVRQLTFVVPGASS